MNILLTSDGSEHTRRAARYLVRLAAQLARPPEVFVLHVHPPIPFPGAAARAGRAALERYLREDSEAALKPATRILDKAGIAHQASWAVGSPVEEIADFVKHKRIELVVMGSHGEGALSSLVLGSVTTKVLATIKTPVLVVR